MLCRGHVRLYKEWDVLEGGSKKVSNGDAHGRFAGHPSQLLPGAGWQLNTRQPAHPRFK